MDIIYSYTRKQAIEDGILVDVTNYTPEGEKIPLVRQYGFTVPVAATRAVYEMLIGLPEDYDGIQDVTGRLCDILVCLYNAIKSNGSSSEFLFNVTARPIKSSIEGKQRTFTLKAHIGPGDNVEPVLTIMFPEED